jgi:hypothetical protein
LRCGKEFGENLEKDSSATYVKGVNGYHVTNVTTRESGK